MTSWTHGTYAEAFDNEGNSRWVLIQRHKSQEAAEKAVARWAARVNGTARNRPRPFISSGIIFGKGTRFKACDLPLNAQLGSEL